MGFDMHDVGNVYENREPVKEPIDQMDRTKVNLAIINTINVESETLDIARLVNKDIY
jgi:hypothetical protein